MKFSESTLKLMPNYDKLSHEVLEHKFSKTKLGIMLNECIMYKMKCVWYMIDTNKLKLLLDTSSKL